MTRHALASLILLVILSGCASHMCSLRTPCKGLPLQVPDAGAVSRVEVIEYPAEQELLTRGVGPCAVTVTDPVAIAEVLSDLRDLPGEWIDAGPTTAAYPRQLNVVGANGALLAFQYKDGAARATVEASRRAYLSSDPGVTDRLRKIHERFIPQCLFPAR